MEIVLGIILAVCLVLLAVVIGLFAFGVGSCFDRKYIIKGMTVVEGILFLLLVCCVGGLVWMA